MKKFLGLLSFLIVLSGCGKYETSLETLGANSSFSDVEIPDDFQAPEDELDVDEEKPDEIIEEEIPPPEDPISLVDTFAVFDKIYSLAHGKAQRWDGCEEEKASNGGYNSDSKCGTAFFHPNFMDNLNQAFFKCVSDSAEKAGYPRPSRIFIRHLGSYNDRNSRGSSSLSHHAYARAWDIVNFNIYDKEGKRYKISTYLRDYKDEQAIFYDEFRDCWRDSLPSSCVPGKKEYKGSVGHKASKLGGNSLHNDHLHLAYPLCAG